MKTVEAYILMVGGLLEKFREECVFVCFER